MNLLQLKESLAGYQPPANASVYITALWYDAKGNWQKAHELIQDISGKDAAWIHAYLHRKEGDAGNAGYWYSKAGKKPAACTLQEEWEQIAAALLQ